MSEHDKESIQKIHLTSNQSNKSELSYNKTELYTIRCICGSEILVVPDLKAMDKAVQNHIAEHKQTKDDPSKLTWLEDFLTEQVLIVASKINLPK